MMFTGRIERNIFFYYHIVVGCMELFFKMYTCIFIKSAVNLFTHAGNTVRCL